MKILVFSGRVEAGKKVGRHLGFATINLKISPLVSKNQWGIYFSLVKIGNNFYPAVTNLGPAKTFGALKPICETHLLTLNKKLYGQRVTKLLLAKIRPVKKFKNAGELRTQIGKDAALARKFFRL